MKKMLELAVCVYALFSGAQTQAAPETITTRIGDLNFSHDFENGYPTVETQEKLLDEMDFQRACQAYDPRSRLSCSKTSAHQSSQSSGLAKR